MILALGFVSQILFFTRTLLQWIMSEKAKKVLSPTIYWILSIIASYLFFIYGWYRHDFSILLGQVITYYIYVWNLKENGVWNKINSLFQALLIITPILGIGFLLKDFHGFLDNFLRNNSIPLWLVIFGSLGQVIFTLRFIYQWIYSMKKKESLLPLGFWIISLIGSGIIVLYGIIRFDLILILGQSVGFIAYARNISIYKKELIVTYNVE
ncbi:MAG: lipid-A-disaccharide synthase N-terminal domain-containing protein [Bacteroidota bacterium]|nr:lipid-A-disaccharide synthase N-terminal domain-containing protein [Bacteroidota bacterium]